MTIGDVLLFTLSAMGAVFIVSPFAALFPAVFFLWLYRRMNSVVALVALVDCVLVHSRECVELGERIRRWHGSALSNDFAPPSYRAVLGLSLAKYLASLGEHDEAVREAQKAGELARGNLAYRLQQALLLAWLQRWDALEVLLDEIEIRFPRRAPADPTYRELRSRIESAPARSSD